MKRLWVVSYDIASDRRRAAISRFLLGYGERIEESVFECFLRADQIPAFSRRIQALIEPQEDAVALIPMCRDCRAKFEGYGLGRREHLECSHFAVV